MHFIQAPIIAEKIPAMQRFGMNRVLMYSRDGLVSRSKADLYLNKFEKHPWLSKNYELAVERNGTMEYHTPGNAIRQYPIWNLDRDSAFYLKDYADSNDIVFIRNTVNNIRIANSRSDDVLRRRVREMWEMVTTYGDLGSRKTKFVIYGFFQYRLAFCMGMSGATSEIIVADGPAYKIFTPDGKLIDPVPEIRTMLAAKYLVPLDLAESKWAVGLRCFQLMPEYLRHFYSNMERIEVDQDDLKASLAGVRKEWGTDYRKYVQSTLRKGYVASRPHANIWFALGDARLCDSCSVAFACRLYKRGAVCTLPNAETQSLAQLFGSRDSKDVITGISKVLQFQADRFEQAAEQEHLSRIEARDKGLEPPKLDPEISRMANDLQKNAKQYATLINPMLMKPQVTVQINQGEVGLEPTKVTPKELASAARELEQAGTPRGEITPSMVYEHLAMKTGGPVIEGDVVDGVKRDF